MGHLRFTARANGFPRHLVLADNLRMVGPADHRVNDPLNDDAHAAAFSAGALASAKPAFWWSSSSSANVSMATTKAPALTM